MAGSHRSRIRKETLIEAFKNVEFFIRCDWSNTPPRSWLRFHWLLIFAVIFFVSSVSSNAAEVMPPQPNRYFNDYAKVVRPEVAEQLNQKLEAFERETSSQIVVAVFPKMQSDSAIEDYTQRVAQNWQVGQKDKNNGAVLFVFIQDRKMFIQVGYGLEGALPDALAKRIVEDEIKPFFKAGDYTGGLNTGVAAILQAVKGEYKGSGRTVGEGTSRGAPRGLLLFILIAVAIFFSFFRRLHRGMVYSGRGRHHYGAGPIFGGGGWGRGGGGGFSGGGGSFGGGGAGGSW